MSWSSGSKLFSNLAEIIADTVRDEDDRVVIYKAMIAEFEAFDCDTLMECRDIDVILDEVLDELYDYDELEEEDEEDEWPDGGREHF